MRYWGKLSGLVLGYLSGTGFWGMAIGCWLGHLYDASRATRRHGFFTDQRTRQSLFFSTTFQVMGHLSKAKGRVTEADIQTALWFMDFLQLHGQARNAAQTAFRQGKETHYPLRQKLREFRAICFGRQDLLRTFIDIQLKTAFADGQLHAKERHILYVIGEELGVSRLQFDRRIQMMEGAYEFTDTGTGDKGMHSSSHGPTLSDACKVLGVKVSDEVTTIKRAYRKLMSEHHPDKLLAKGLPAEMMEMAKQKTQQIQAAYDLIKREKGFK